LGDSKNTLISFDERRKWRVSAVQNDNLIEIADALGDMMYILCGTIIEHGLQHKIEAVFDEIQRSNMSKLDHSGNPIYRTERWWKGLIILNPIFLKYWANNKVCILLLFEDFTIGMNPVPMLKR
jgi:hypothetical protein